MCHLSPSLAHQLCRSGTGDITQPSRRGAAGQNTKYQQDKYAKCQLDKYKMPTTGSLIDSARPLHTSFQRHLSSHREGEKAFKKHHKNCECCPYHSLFKGHKVVVNNVFLNSQQCNQCLKCQVSGHKIFRKSGNFSAKLKFFFKNLKIVIKYCHHKL